MIIDITHKNNYRSNENPRGYRFFQLRQNNSHLSFMMGVDMKLVRTE